MIFEQIYQDKGITSEFVGKRNLIATMTTAEGDVCNQNIARNRKLFLGNKNVSWVVLQVI